MDKFHIELCEDQAKWDEFVEQSPHGSIFSRTSFLSCLQDKVQCYIVYGHDAKPVLGLPVCEAPAFVPYGSYTTFRFAIYHGPMFSNSIERLPLHSAVPQKLASMECAFQSLTRNHSVLQFSTDPRFYDMRAFQWFNYHNPDGGRFDVSLRYTALLPVADYSQEEHLRSVRELRRREFNRAIKNGVACETSQEVDLLDLLEDLVYERQSLAREDADRRARRLIAEKGIREGWAECYVARLRDGTVASAHLWVFDKNRAYYLFAGNDPAARQIGASTYLLFWAFERMRQRGISVVDLIGLNSPNRGDYKISFNATPTQCFIARWQRPA